MKNYMFEKVQKNKITKGVVKANTPEEARIKVDTNKYEFVFNEIRNSSVYEEYIIIQLLTEGELDLIESKLITM